MGVRPFGKSGGLICLPPRGTVIMYLAPDTRNHHGFDQGSRIRDSSFLGETDSVDSIRFSRASTTYP